MLRRRPWPRNVQCFKACLARCGRLHHCPQLFPLLYLHLSHPHWFPPCYGDVQASIYDEKDAPVVFSGGPLPRVYFDIAIGDAAPERVEFKLYANVVPKTAENFRCLCTGANLWFDVVVNCDFCDFSVCFLVLLV